MTEDGDEESAVITPKRPGLGRRVLEKSALQRSLTPSRMSEHLPIRVGQDQDRPTYNEDYLKELRDSTPSTPNYTSSEQAKEEDVEEKAVDVAAKFGEVMEISSIGQTVIPSEAEIREKKARRARLAREREQEQDFISLDDAGSEDEWSLDTRRKEKQETRLVRDDEDFAEGFDEYVEDGRIALGRKAEREQQRRQREEMRELIEEAENTSENDSDAEQKAAYEAAQTRAAMGLNHIDTSRPKTPPKITSLPRLANSLERLRATLATLEQSKAQLVNRMEELRKEKADIAVREGEIQTLIKEAGEKYERLRREAGLSPNVEEGLPGDNVQNHRGLESIGASLAASNAASENESP